jgi:hypothetical protein
MTKKRFEISILLKYSLIVVFLMVSGRIGYSTNNELKIFNTSLLEKDFKESSLIYNETQLSELGLSKSVFESAFSGWKKLRENKLITSNILSIADLSQSSNSRRLYIIDLDNSIVLYNTYVAHGRNSGEEYANSFSNSPESLKSSLGFFLTGETYTGKHGLSLHLKGLEKGINDLAECRSIVIHGADYVDESFIEKYGRLGRSQGCPAISQELTLPIIRNIKGGSCFMIYHPSYLKYTKDSFN